MAGYLVKIGVDNSKIVREFLNTKSMAAIKFLGQAMYEMKFDEKEISLFFLSNKDFIKMVEKRRYRNMVEKFSII